MNDMTFLCHGGWGCKYHSVWIPTCRRTPPKYAAERFVAFEKGKSAIHFARTYEGEARNFTGERFRVRESFVSAAGRDEQVMRECIRGQEQEDKHLDQLRLLDWPSLCGFLMYPPPWVVHDFHPL